MLTLNELSTMHKSVCTIYQGVWNMVQFSIQPLHVDEKLFSNSQKNVSQKSLVRLSSGPSQLVDYHSNVIQ